MDRFTENSIVTDEKITAEIDETRRRGYSIDDEEYTEGIRCVAAPIYKTDRGMIAAVGISGPASRMTDAKITEVGNFLMNLIKEKTISTQSTE